MQHAVGNLLAQSVAGFAGFLSVFAIGWKKLAEKWVSVRGMAALLATS